MSYKLRFVQKIEQRNKNEFLELERKFINFEKANPDMPQGKRYLPVSGKESTNTLIWECEFPTLEELTSQLQAIYNDLEHERLLRQQTEYMEDSYAEIYEIFE